jgi:hypothetical protein
MILNRFLWSKYHVKNFLVVLTILANSFLINNAETKESLLDLSKDNEQTIHQLISAINSGVEKNIQSMIMRLYSPEFLSAFPMESHIDYILGHHILAGQLKFHSLDSNIKCIT